ncbi:MAG: ABC transporter permease [Fusobacterium sp. JB021]|nr:ABC transporter permease [Fusobacterium sp. JB020]MDP0493943.1 ABC transporter permease [Fusobacterium sp. JB021]MDP0505645.1 ABC transporter permease [Fusobacterium sp. JB019]
MLVGTLEQSLIFAIMVMGVYISFRILDFPDMTVDGSFPLGASIVASCLVKGVNPVLALILAVIGGSIAGFITGYINVKYKIANLLAGIIVMTGLYSINIKIMGRSNISLFTVNHLFTLNINKLLLIGIIVVLCKLALDFLFKTKFGFILKALGDNETLVETLGVNKNKLKIYGLVISNGIVALSGGLYAQYQGFADVGMGTGTIVTGLASIIIGETIIKNRRKFALTTTVIVGTIIYKIIITLALKIGFNASDLKLISAIIVVVILALKNNKVLKKGGIKNA